MKERGPGLVQALVNHLAGPKSPIGDPNGLDPAGIRAVEDAAGVALSPSMAALLAFDAGFAERELLWFADGSPRVRPLAAWIAEFVGPFAPAFDEVCAARFPGLALPLDLGGESGRLLYLGDPDEHGEYPVLFWDVDDTPLLGVDDAGFDTWLGRRVGLLGPRAFATEVKATSKRLLGRQAPLELDQPLKRLPRPVPGPAPGSVAHPQVTAPAPRKPRRLTDAQVAQGLSERAAGTNAARLAELIAEAKARGLPVEAFDAALVAAAFAGPLAAVEALLAAGANPNATGRYGCALARAAWNADDRVHHALLAAGADPNGPSILGATALHQIVERGRTELVRAYLAAGADAGRRDQYGFTPLHTALRAPANGHLPPPEIVAALAPEAPLSGAPPLAVAAVEGATAEHLRLLLAAGVDPNERSPYLSRTALHAAFDHRRDDLAPLLIAAGADRFAADERGITLESVYGPDGGDVRPIAVSYAESPGRQRLSITLSIAVVNPHHVFARPLLDGATWAQLAAAGVLGGGAIDVTKNTDFSSLTGAGFHRVPLELEVTGLSAAFVSWMLAILLGERGGLLTGAGYDPNARVVGIAAVGSAAGASAVTPERVRGWVVAPWSVFGEGTTPVARGPKPGIRAQFPAPPGPAEIAAFAAACRAWFATSVAWKPLPTERTTAWMLDFGEPRVTGAEAFLPLIDFGDPKRPGPWPYDEAAPAEVFAQIASRAAAPMTLTLPG